MEYIRIIPRDVENNHYDIADENGRIFAIRGKHIRDERKDQTKEINTDLNSILNVLAKD